MNRTTNKLLVTILAFYLISGGAALADPIAPSTAKAAVTKYMRFVKPAKLKVHKKASALPVKSS